MANADAITPEQIETTLAQALKAVQPAENRPPTVLARLTECRKVIQHYRKQGYSAQQIATALKQPPLGLTVSPSLLRKALAARRRRPVDDTPVVFTPIQPASAATPARK